MGTVTGITFSNLPAETGMVLDIDNTAGNSVTIGSTEVIASTDTGRYWVSVFNDGTDIITLGRSEVQS